MNIKDFLKSNNRTIVIYNPLSNVGHFDSWCNIFTKIFLDSDWKVIVVTNNATKLIETLSQSNNLILSKLLIIDKFYDLYKNQKKTYLEKIIRKLNIPQFSSKIKLKEQRVNQSSKNVIINLYARVFNYLIRKLQNYLLKFLPNTIIISAHNPVDFATDIDCLVNALGGRPNIVLNMYLDLYDPAPVLWEKFAQKMSCNWVGIHMDLSRYLKSRPYSKSKKLKIIYTINEIEEQFINDSRNEINYRWLPDVTNVMLPLKSSQIVLDVLNHASGRKIIFLGGSIGGSKNLSLWSELFLKLDHRYWYFVQIGKIEYPTLSSDDLEGLQNLQKSNLEQIYIKDMYLPDETVFNELMSVSSIIWGVYRDFDRSSNILTKAALLSKPIIVSNKFLMGQRVETYKIGKAVSETDVNLVSKGLDWLINNPIPAENFKHYADIYSTDALSKKLNESLMQILV